MSEIESLQSALRSVVDRAAPSVYAVTAFNDSPTDSALWLGQLRGRAFAAVVERSPRSCGSAFAISDVGDLLTNEHVVSGAASVWVTDDSGQSWPAIVVGTDPRSDLAILRIPASTTPLRFAATTSTRGDLSVTLGNPDGISAEGAMSASVGCVSATGRALPSLSLRERRAYADLIQTTTPIISGSSGGPLLNLSGDAIGIVTAVAPADAEREAIGFAITLSPSVQNTIERLRRGEEVTHGYIGVTVADVTATDASTALAGARIDAVEPDAPAAGVLQAGDVVVRFAGEVVESSGAFVQLSAASPVDLDVPITVRRDGAEVELSIRPRRRTQPAEPVTTRTQTLAWAGVRFVNADGGVEVIDADGSPLRAGSIVSAVNGEAVHSVSDLLCVLFANAGKPLIIEAR